MSWIPTFQKEVLKFFLDSKSWLNGPKRRLNQPKQRDATAHLHLSTQLATIASSNWFSSSVVSTISCFQARKRPILPDTDFPVKEYPFPASDTKFLQLADNQFWACSLQEIHFATRFLQILQDNQFAVN